MKLKNWQTMMEFAFSLFHMQTIAQEMMAATSAWGYKRYQGKEGRARHALRGFNPVKAWEDSKHLIILAEAIKKDENVANNEVVRKEFNRLLGTDDTNIIEAVKAWYEVGGQLHSDKSLHTSAHKQKIRYASTEDGFQIVGGKIKFSRLSSLEVLSGKPVLKSIKAVFDKELADSGLKLTAGARAALFTTFQAPSAWLMEYGIPRAKMATFLREYTLALESVLVFFFRDFPRSYQSFQF